MAARCRGRYGTVTSIRGLVVASALAPWERIGLRIVGGESWIGGIRLRFVDVPPDHVGRSSLVGWELTGCPRPVAMIDGLATTNLDVETDADTESKIDPQAWSHELKATAFDHVVVMTSSLERTCGAIESATGEPLKRIREAGSIRQGFHRLGPMIVEVAETAQVRSDIAAFWGFVLIVDDLAEVAGRLGPDVISMPKAAVQPGRFIASFRADVGLGLPLALMTR